MQKTFLKLQACRLSKLFITIKNVKLMSKKLRLVQFVRQKGFEVKEALDLIRGGQVIVNNFPAKNPNFQINPKKEIVEIKAKVSLANIPRKYYLLNKPIETITTTGKDNRKTVMDCIKIDSQIKKTLFPVGRLDYKTTGLLIITNDGHFARKILNPQAGVEKEYRAVVKGTLSPTDIKELQEGVLIKVDEKKNKTKPAKINVITSGENTTCSMIITEGKKRQVRLMFLEVGHKVLELERIRIGRLLLGDLT